MPIHSKFHAHAIRFPWAWNPICFCQIMNLFIPNDYRVSPYSFKIEDGVEKSGVLVKQKYRLTHRFYISENYFNNLTALFDILHTSYVIRRIARINQKD